VAQPRLVFAFACAFLLSTAGVAHARAAFADNGRNPGANSSTGPQGGATFDTQTIGATSGDLNIGGSAGLVLEPTTTGVAGADFIFEWEWVSGTAITDMGGDISLQIFLTGVGSNISQLNVSTVRFNFNGPGTDYAEFALGSSVDLLAGFGVGQTSGFAIIALKGLTPTTTANPNGSLDTTFQTFRTTYIDIDIVTAGAMTGGTGNAADTFSIDAIATTPEPGTWALFGLGLLGLGGIARRRKQRIASAKKSEA
jgi:PEP-CTERM motif-containing protein